MIISVDNKKIIAFFFITGVFIAGFVAHKFLSSSSSSSSEYALINKTITAGVRKHYIINFKPLRVELEKIQKKYSQKTYVYFNYLNNPAWIGLNEREEFTAASTIKVPLSMALLKATEGGKLKLSDSYSLDRLDLNSDFGELYKKVGPDQEFTVEELLKIMLEQSDNTATQAIYSVLGLVGINNPLGDVYTFLGWDLKIPEIGNNQDYSKINLKTLSNLFVALYDAKYLTVENSSKILEYLTDTPFNQRIAAGVPEAVVISHKIGTSDVDQTFSDCGIVYAPNRHYLLCLGSNGGNEKQAAKFMTEVSATVYKYVMNN